MKNVQMYTVKFADLKPEEWLVWREIVDVDGELRLLVPHSNPREYEYPLDGLFKTADEAVAYLKDYGGNDVIGEKFVLCKLVLTPVEIVSVEEGAEDEELIKYVRNVPQIEVGVCEYEDTD